MIFSASLKLTMGGLLAACFLSAYSHAAVVLEYHHVSETTPKSTSISPAHFKAQLDYLANNGFSVVPLSELVDALRAGKPLPDKTVAITFDDAYASVYNTAFPLLKARGWPFTFFVNTEVVGQSTLFVSWAQLRTMAKAGVTIANHSSSHAHLVRLDKNETRAQWRARMKADITTAQQKIQQELGTAPMFMAYPFGEYDVELQALVRELGYLAFGQQSGPLYEKGDLQALPRFPFGGSFTDLDDFILKVNTKPLPIQNIAFYADKTTPLPNLIVAAGARPWLVLNVEGDKLLGNINCFATGQGAINTEVIEGKVWVQAKQPLTQGRTRYNCTAHSGEKNGKQVRFYWYTQQWLATNAKGEWQYQD